MALHLGRLRYNTVARLCDDADDDGAAPSGAGLLQDHPALRPLSEYQLFLDGLGEAESPSPQQPLPKKSFNLR